MNTLFSTATLIGGFVAGMLGGFFILLVGHPIASMFQKDNPLISSASGSDVIAVANTYIVFITLIFVLITLFITVAGIWFSKQFAIRKDKEIKDNMHDLFESLNKDGKLAKKFVKGLEFN